MRVGTLIQILQDVEKDKPDANVILVTGVSPTGSVVINEDFEVQTWEDKRYNSTDAILITKADGKELEAAWKRQARGNYTYKDH